MVETNTSGIIGCMWQDWDLFVRPCHFEALLVDVEKRYCLMCSYEIQSVALCIRTYISNNNNN